VSVPPASSSGSLWLCELTRAGTAIDTAGVVVQVLSSTDISSNGTPQPLTPLGQCLSLTPRCVRELRGSGVVVGQRPVLEHTTQHHQRQQAYASSPLAGVSPVRRPVTRSILCMHAEFQLTQGGELVLRHVLSNLTFDCDGGSVSSVPFSYQGASLTPSSIIACVLIGVRRCGDRGGGLAQCPKSWPTDVRSSGGPWYSWEIRTRCP
jgi:hypothetical protein